MTPKPLRHFWEGVDSDGRELRAYLVTEGHAHEHTVGKSAMGPNRVALDTELPAIEFRTPKKWKNTPEYLEFRREQIEAITRLNATGRRLKVPHEPRETGTTWVRVATVSLREAGECRRLGVSMGVANGKRRPGLLSLDALGVLFTAADAWLDSNGTQSIAKVLRPEAAP